MGGSLIARVTPCCQSSTQRRKLENRLDSETTASESAEVTSRWGLIKLSRGSARRESPVSACTPRDQGSEYCGRNFGKTAATRYL